MQMKIFFTWFPCSAWEPFKTPPRREQDEGQKRTTVLSPIPNQILAIPLTTPTARDQAGDQGSRPDRAGREINCILAGGAAQIATHGFQSRSGT